MPGFKTFTFAHKRDLAQFVSVPSPAGLAQLGGDNCASLDPFGLAQLGWRSWAGAIGLAQLGGDINVTWRNLCLCRPEGPRRRAVFCGAVGGNFTPLCNALFYWVVPAPSLPCLRYVKYLPPPCRSSLRKLLAAVAAPEITPDPLGQGMMFGI